MCINVILKAFCLWSFRSEGCIEESKQTTVLGKRHQSEHYQEKLAPKGERMSGQMGR